MTGFLRARPVMLTMRCVFFALLILIAVLSLIPNPDDVPGGSAFSRWVAALVLGSEAHADKVSHFIAYGVLGGAGILAALRPAGRLWVLAILLVAYSGLMEVLQGFTAVREPDMADMVANALGVVAGMASASVLVMLGGRMARTAP